MLHRQSRTRTLAGVFLFSIIAGTGMQGAIAPAAHAGEVSLQGVTARWNDNAFVKPDGCGNFSIDWVNGSGRELLMIRVQVFRSNGFTLFWQSAIPAQPGESGTFSQVICESRLTDGLGPYRVDLTIEDYSFTGGGSYVASAPLTFLATAPAPAPAPAPPPPAAAPATPVAPTVTRAPKRPSSVQVRLDGTSARISWRKASRLSEGVRYEVTAFPGGKSCRTQENSCVIRGLKRGGEYQFAIVATNSVGASPTATSKVIRVPQPQSPRPAATQRPSQPRPTPPKPEADLS